MSDFKDEWFKLVLDELRKNNNKFDELKNSTDQKIDSLEEKIFERLKESEHQHQDLFVTQKMLCKEHERMNDLLEEHIRRTEVNEKMIERLDSRTSDIEQEIRPLVENHTSEQIMKKAHDKKIKKVILWLGAVATIMSIVGGLLKILQIF